MSKDTSVEEGNKINDQDKAEYEIFKGNAIIREFMNEPKPPIRCKYHSSWDWLMPVVEKINDNRFYVTIDSWAGVEIYDRSKRLTGEPIVTIDNNDKELLINLVWQAIIQFIQWYNPTLKQIK